jgi:hypothetical protein
VEQRHKWDRLWPVSDRRSGVVHPLIYKHPITGLQTMCFHTGWQSSSLHDVCAAIQHIWADAVLATNVTTPWTTFAGMIDTFMWDKGTPQQRMATPLETTQILDEIDRCVHSSPPRRLPTVYPCSFAPIKLGRQLNYRGSHT